MTAPLPLIRPAFAGDAAGIRAVLEAAFRSHAEAELVEQLRSSGDLVLELVAVFAGRPIGHAAFVRLAIEANGVRVPAVGLAPLSVVPERQRQGTGGALVRAGLHRLAAVGETIAFVLGEPNYYGRFGFAAAAAVPFDSVYAGPYLQALRLSPDAPSAGRLRYPPAFDRLPTEA